MPTSSDIDATAARDAERAARHGAALKELTEIGMDLARGLRGQTGDAGEVALAFSRLSRAIRLTIALEDRLADGQVERRRVAEQARAEARQRAADNRDWVRESVVEAIERDADDDAAVEPLLAALREKLTELDELDLTDQGAAEVIERICKDLGVPYDPDLWDNEPLPGAPDWANIPPAPRVPNPYPAWDDPNAGQYRPP